MRLKESLEKLRKGEEERNKDYLFGDYTGQERQLTWPRMTFKENCKGRKDKEEETKEGKSSNIILNLFTGKLKRYKEQGGRNIEWKSNNNIYSLFRNYSGQKWQIT